MRTIKQLKNHQFSATDKYFLFTDGSLREQHTANALMGIGCSIRDKEGKKVLFYSEEIRVSNLPEYANKNSFEEMALLNSLLICKDKNIKNLHIQNDNSGLMTKITQYLDAKELNHQDDLNNLLKANPIRLKIYELLNSFDEVFAEFIGRDLNNEADFYSRYTSSLKHENFLKMYAPVQEKSQQLVQEVRNSMAKKALKNRPHTLVFLPYKDTKAEIVKLHNNVAQNRYEATFKGNTIHAAYTKENKELVLLFLSLNLVTEKSSISFINKPHLDLKYNDNLWLSFSNMAQKSAKEKVFHISPQMAKELEDNQNFDFSKTVSGNNLRLLTQAAFGVNGYHVRKKILTPSPKP